MANNGGISIVSRAEWNARPPKTRSRLTLPVANCFIHHTAGHESTDLASGKRIVQSIQNFHMDTREWDDIGYSFLIGGDGSIFEGRGFDVIGAHTEKHNSTSYGIVFLGTFTASLPTPAAINSAKALIGAAIGRGHLLSNYVLKGHRQVCLTECPGHALFHEIQTWPNWTN